MPLPFNPPIDAPGNQDCPKMHHLPGLGRNYAVPETESRYSRPDSVKSSRCSIDCTHEFNREPIEHFDQQVIDSDLIIRSVKRESTVPASDQRS